MHVVVLCYLGRVAGVFGHAAHCECAFSSLVSVNRDAASIFNDFVDHNASAAWFDCGLPERPSLLEVFFAFDVHGACVSTVSPVLD